jgi:RNA polymerase sigma factor (sigma-70 family)
MARHEGIIEMDASSQFEPDHATAFTTTHWSIVLAAKDGDDAVVDPALESLCKAYWFPLYAFIRRRGYQVHEAQDLTQAFFARLLEKDFLRAIDRRKGKFRSFLLAALDHFLANEWRRAKAQKRGGGATFIPLDEVGERQYLQTPALSPEQLFEQQWAMALLEKSLTQLRAEFKASEKSALFDALKVFLTSEKREVSYAQLSSRLGISEAALKMAVSRLRRRFGEILRAEIAATVTGREEVDQELRDLFAALSC